MYSASARQNVRYFRNQLDSLQFRNVNTIKKAERRLGKVPGAVAAEVRDSLRGALENVDRDENELVEDEEMHGDEDEFDADEFETGPYFPQTDNTQPGQSTQEDVFGATQFDTSNLGGDNFASSSIPHDYDNRPVMDYWLSGKIPYSVPGISSMKLMGIDSDRLWEIFFQKAIPLGLLEVYIDDARAGGDEAGPSRHIDRVRSRGETIADEVIDNSDSDDDEEYIPSDDDIDTEEHWVNEMEAEADERGISCAVSSGPLAIGTVVDVVYASEPPNLNATPEETPCFNGLPIVYLVFMFMLFTTIFDNKFLTTYYRLALKFYLPNGQQMRFHVQGDVNAIDTRALLKPIFSLSKYQLQIFPLREFILPSVAR
ncbi:unnamed protein product [Cuscuta campestris]|uniref:Uncharacterized protein n=1 Tax=Cuscuta campestris TaxID=132261 RepID=A0A484LRT5_9ASTE|nr:unnamed protein product [Cuscuta campestris]